MKTHELKSWPEFFQPLLLGTKSCELRRNDRDYQVGDIIILHEYEPRDESYTGRELRKRVVYVLLGAGIGCIAPLKGLALGYCILSLADIGSEAHVAAAA